MADSNTIISLGFLAYYLACIFYVWAFMFSNKTMERDDFKAHLIILLLAPYTAWIVYAFVTHTPKLKVYQ